MTIIRAQNLTKSFTVRGNKNLLTGLWRPEKRRITGVNSVSFEVSQGEAVAFLGPNGAGKTTTTKMMTGLVAPTSGSISVLGQNPFDRHPDFLRSIGLVMGNRAGLNWDLTARQSFWLNRHIYKMTEKNYLDRTKQLSELLDVDRHLDVQVRRLSLGERMKLELIGAILHNPKLLFLDEPTIGLDIKAKKTIRNFLKGLRHAGETTLILTSHDMDDIEEVCNRVIVINDGHKVYDDSLRSLSNQYKEVRFVRFAFIKSPGTSQLGRFGSIIDSTDDDVLMRIDAGKMVGVIAEVSKLYPLSDIKVEGVPLEEMMADLYDITPDVSLKP